MSAIFLKIRGQSGFEFSSDQGIHLNYTKDFALPTFSGILYAGEDKQFIGGFDGVTINLAAVFTDYSIKTDTIQWSQVSGNTGSFSSPNRLDTLFSTAASNLSAVVLRVTITRTTVAGSIQVSDDLSLSDQPFDATSSNVIKLNATINKDNILYNSSWVGSDDQTPEGDTDVILWNVPSTRKTYSYDGYKVQAFNKTFKQWYDVQAGGAQSDVGSYKVTDDTLVYRYLPVWKKPNNKQVIGSSVPVLKTTIGGTNATSYGLFDSVKPETYFNSRHSSPSVNRLAVSVGSVIESDIVKPAVKVLSELKDLSSNRHLNTLTDISGSDSLSNKTIKTSSDVHSLSVTRTSGISLGQLGN